MAKISFVLLVVTLIVFQQVCEAHRPIDFNEEVLEKDLHEAKDLIEEDLKEKETSIRNLESEVSLLTKSEMMLTQLEHAYKNGKSLERFGKRLKKFNRRIKRAPEEVRYVSIIQSILKDLGLNGGRN
ncbi:unnamed protein product [Arabidopsis lyrata]|uniref:Uncharacterized protein n=1 Tax=Arabidopsis lyrata subsp. lyrata TaxID=81972 RepID=D7LAH7_ARALL|nr:uncharacterized protein LOC9318259 [Arabidopsis lyrata subsp. lyrata]EFH58451.1 hypothetical protein ARALYDRAFT_896138 [Arabidopsis lyrata subsp. lyrata]CAH8258965.1 unnamed protein product [Arabidopsis lyrata]|eukprot:XP_002882192.1 uncharacterized protein LOC9318259 [Arabidopsis lyrata subsp. lyrata]